MGPTHVASKESSCSSLRSDVEATVGRAVCACMRQIPSLPGKPTRAHTMQRPGGRAGGQPR